MASTDNVLRFDQLELYDQKIKALIGTKVDSVSGKALSTNDYTDAEKTKLAGIEEGANKYVHPSYTSRDSGFYKFAVDSTGHISSVTAVTKSDITGLGISGGGGQTYSPATSTADGLMSSTDKTNLDKLVSNTAGYQTASDVSNAINSANHLKHVFADSLPEVSAADVNTIYIVPKSSGSETGNTCNEYMLNSAGTAFELIGDTAITLNYITDAQINSLFS